LPELQGAVAGSSGALAVARRSAGRARQATRHAISAVWARQRGITFEHPLVVWGKEGRFPKVENLGGRIVLGRGVSFAGARLPVFLGVGDHGVLRIGDGAFLNEAANIYADSRVEIGARTLIANFVCIMDTNMHEVEANGGVKTAPIKIGKNVWLGLGTIVLPGVTIGDNTVVAAGSVVVESLPADVLAAGNPARVKRSINAPDGWCRR
jgi:maltose O-acetyltransferase